MSKVQLAFNIDNDAGLYEVKMSTATLHVGGLDYAPALTDAPAVAAGQKSAGSLEYRIPYGISFGRDQLVLRPDGASFQAAEVPLGSTGTLVDFPPIVDPVRATLTAGTVTLTATEVQISEGYRGSAVADRDHVFLRVRLTGSQTTENGANTVLAWLKTPDGHTTASYDDGKVDEPNASLIGWPQAPADAEGYYWFQVPEDVGGTYTLMYNRDGVIGSMDLAIPPVPDGWGNPSKWAEPTPKAKMFAWVNGGLVELLSADISDEGASHRAVVRLLLSANLAHEMAMPTPTLHTAEQDFPIRLSTGNNPRAGEVSEITVDVDLDPSVTSLADATLVFGDSSAAQISLSLGNTPAGSNGEPIPQDISGTLTTTTDTVVLSSSLITSYLLNATPAPSGKRVLRVYVTGSTSTESGANTLETTLQLPDGSTTSQVGASHPPRSNSSLTGWPISPADQGGVFEFFIPEKYTGAYTMSYNRDGNTAFVTFTLK